MKKNSIIIMVVFILLSITMGCKKVPVTPSGSSSMDDSENLSEVAMSIDTSSDYSSNSNPDSMSAIISTDIVSKSISNQSKPNSISNSSSSSSIQKDTVLFDTYMNPSVPKAKFQAKILYLTGVPPFDEAVILGTLQGLLSNAGTEQIYIRANATYDLWLQEMKKSFGVTVVDGLTTWDLITKFKSKISGYILCKSTMGSYPGVAGTVNIDRSVNVASTLANQYNAIVVTEANKGKIESLGLTCLLDVTGWDEKKLLETETFLSKLNKNIAIEQQPYFGAEQRDYAVMSNAFLFFTPKGENLRSTILQKLNKGSPVFGWGDPEQGEIGFISQIAQTISGYNVATTGSYNLSTLSGFKLQNLKQKTAVSAKTEQKHTVCFKMTDGSNITWFLANLNNRQWFGNASRGNFKMGWGIAATMIDNAAPVTKWYYDNMSVNDGFILAAGGLGYTYPQYQEKEQLKLQVRKINDYMRRSDLNIAEIVGNRAFNDLATWDYYTAQPDIDGLFYIDYNNYALYRGAIIWSNGKPIISTRYNLWKLGDSNYLLPGGSPQNIINSVNEASTDPKSADSYSLVDVHAWSMSMTDVKNTIAGFDSDVRVVSPQEFVKLIKENVTPEN